MADDEKSNFVQFGTEQPESAWDVKAKERNKFLPLWKQEVRDEKGRKRLHGAFTGGFSAGYFNTVGSKEGYLRSICKFKIPQLTMSKNFKGFQPSTFVSSRLNRAKLQAARPEDYMDEEDLQELEESKQTKVSEEFDSTEGSQQEILRRKTAAKLINDDTQSSALGVLPGKLIEDLIGPAKDSVGVKLLRQLGWREGQGIGPRRKRKREMGSINDDDHHYAPKDQDLFLFEVKNNQFGVGYNPHKNAPEFKLNGGKHSARKSKGFGVGIFEDDDEDVYERVQAETDIVMDGTGSGLMTQTKSKNRELNDSNIRGVDGKTALVGFSFAQGSVYIHKWYSSPDVPADWRPEHKFDEQGPLEVSPDAGVLHPARMHLNAENRRDILGEEPINAPQRSVFSFVSVEDQGRLQQFIEQAKTGNSGTADESVESSGADPYHLDPSTAKEALKGFIPFANDPAKQNRYKMFLKAKSTGDAVGPWPPHMSKIEVNHEMTEFVKAAQLYRPLSGILASRFTSSATASASAIVSDTISAESQPKAQSDAANAASANMYGTLTRTKKDWFPTRLLCKRFNVVNPHPDHDESATLKDSSDPRARVGAEKLDSKKEVLNERTMAGLLAERDRMLAKGVALQAVVSSKNGSDNGDSISSLITERAETEAKGKIDDSDSDEDEDDEDENVVTESKVERPSMDIFKAIFDTDSESDSEDEDPGKQTSISKPKANTSSSVPERIEFVPKDKRTTKKNSDANGNSLQDSTKKQKTKKKSGKLNLSRLTITLDDEETNDAFTKPKKKAKLAQTKNSHGNDASEESTANPAVVEEVSSKVEDPRPVDEVATFKKVAVRNKRHRASAADFL
ncbi:hypothetical protein HK098_002387 [Nowakowskiella sp. JEL0407]|nr:hypothetical protein HK098_002387 [Nowakowskiella sp. JEL0407]